MKNNEVLAEMRTYMRDHAAGSFLAIKLLEGLEDKFSDEELGRTAAKLREEIEADQAQLMDLLEELGGRSRFKETMARITERIARFKLLHPPGKVATLESLETLGLGILGKRALWRALQQAPLDDGLDVDLDSLIERAESQYETVESLRLDWARDMFHAKPEGADL